MAAREKRRGGARKGAGRPTQIEGAPRRNRVVMLLTDAELDALKAAAAADQKAAGTKAREIVVRALRRGK